MVSAERIGYQGNVPFFICFLLVTTLTTALCLCKLGIRALWQDEGETAVLAQSVLRQGVPKATIGQNLVFQNVPSYNSQYLWTFHPWGQFYLAAAGLVVLGNTEFAARLPFALCGVLTVALLYVFVSRHWKNLFTATLSALLLATSATFIVHCRQCRYYGLSTLTCLTIVVTFVELIKNPRWYWRIVFGASLAAQFYADFGTFFAMLPGLALSLWPMGARKKQLSAFATSSALALLLITPGLLLHWNRLTTPVAIKFDLSQKLLTHICYLDGWFIPLLLLIPAMAILTWRLLKAREHLTDQDRISITCFFVVVSAAAAMVWMAPYPHIRYLVPQISLSKLLFAVILMNGYAALRNRKSTKPAARTVLTVIIVIAVFTNTLSLPMQYIVDLRDYKTPDFCSKSKPFLRFDFAGLLYELTHDFVCPNRITKNVADDLANAGETVVVNYGDLPLMFYRPDLQVCGAPGSENILSSLQNPPDLIIINLFYNPGFDRFVSDVLEHHKYIIFRISTPAMIWGNIPEPREHRFATPTEEFPFVVCLRQDHKARMSKLPQTTEQLQKRWYRYVGK